MSRQMRGQALTEFLVISLVLIPLFLLLPVIGKYQDISHASRLLGHSKEEITKRVYRRVGEVVSPTK